MKKIVLRNLSSLVQELIQDKSEAEKIDYEKAVISILEDAAVERAVEHDIALMKSWEDERDDVAESAHACHHCCCCCRKHA